MLDIEPIKKREELKSKAEKMPRKNINNEVVHLWLEQYEYAQEQAELQKKLKQLPALLDELERTRGAAKDLREALDSLPNKPLKHYCYDVLNKTQWLEGEG